MNMYADELRKLTDEAIANQIIATNAELEAARGWCQVNADFYVETVAKPAMRESAVAGKRWCELSIRVGTVFCNKVLTRYDVDQLVTFVSQIIYMQLGVGIQTCNNLGDTAELFLSW
jgi:hypothetical protein